ncbi:MAG: hypothetical protein ACO29V_03345 [Limnohabitans sp.]
MLTFIEAIRVQYRLNRLLRAMTREGLTTTQALWAIERHIDQGTITLLEEEWLS